jgi:hypothetical protein
MHSITSPENSEYLTLAHWPRPFHPLQKTRQHQAATSNAF